MLLGRGMATISLFCSPRKRVMALFLRTVLCGSVAMRALFAAWAQFLRSDFRVTVFCAARRSASVVRVSSRYRALAPGYDHFCDNIGWYITQ